MRVCQIFFAGLCLLWSGHVWAAVTLVQSNSAATSAVTSASCGTLNSAVAAGDLIIVDGMWGNQTGTITVTDSAGNTYTQVPSSPRSDGFSGGNEAFQFWAINSSARASLTATVSVSGGGSHTIRCATWDYHSTTGWNSSPVDVSSAASSATGVTTGSFGNITPSAAGELVKGVVETANGGQTAFSVSGCTLQDSDSNALGTGYGGSLRTEGADVQNAASAPMTCSWSWTGNAAAFSAIGTAFKPAPAGGGGPGFVRRPRGWISLFSIPANTPEMGPLVQSASHTNFFQRPDGSAIVLTGSQTWNTLQDTSESTTPEAFNFDAYVQFLVAHGHNATILWHKDLPTYCNWGADGGGTTWHTTLWQWQRTGPGTASDGLPKFDLNSPNPAYYDRLLARVQQLGRNGIYAIVQLFDGLGLTDNRCAGDGFPLSAANNINSVDDGGSTGSMTMTAANSLTAIQEAYVKKVIDTLNAEPNVIWEISEEAPDNSTWWENFLIDLIHKYEGGGTLSQTGETFPGKTYRHPVLYPSLNVSGASDTTLYNSNADAVAPLGTSHVVGTSKCGSGSPACKVSIVDSDHNYFGTMWTDSQLAVRNVIWENFTNGNSYLYMDPYVIWWPGGNRNLCNNGVRPANAVCSSIVSASGSWQENVRRNLGYVALYGNGKLKLANATPQPALCQTGFCLAHNVAQGEFLVYFPSGGTQWVNLSAQSGHTLHVEWLDTVTGTIYPQADYMATSSPQQSFTVPASVTSTDAVLYLVDVNGH